MNIQILVLHYCTAYYLEKYKSHLLFIKIKVSFSKGAHYLCSPEWQLQVRLFGIFNDYFLDADMALGSPAMNKFQNFFQRTLQYICGAVTKLYIFVQVKNSTCQLQYIWIRIWALYDSIEWTHHLPKA